MARRSRRHWFNDLARDTRDLNYLARVYGPKTPEEAAARLAGLKRTLIVLGVIAALLVVAVVATLKNTKPPEPAQVTATFEARVRSAVGADAVVVTPAALTAAVSAKVTPTPIPTATIDPRLLVRYEETTVDSNGNVRTQCLIKGNINSKGVKIYHVPGSSAYASTKIDTSKGERWFCTEADALAAGWSPPGQ